MPSFLAVASPANRHPIRNAPMVPRLCQPWEARPDARKSGPFVLGPVMCMTTYIRSGSGSVWVSVAGVVVVMVRW